MQICPNCGATWSGGEVCPACNTRLTVRLPLGWLRVAVLGLALGGLGLLFYAWRGVPVPRRTVAQLAQGQPLAYVEVQGVVMRSPRYAAATQQLTFWVQDDTGQVPVFAFGAVTEALAQTQGLPQVGDQVTLAGVVQLQGDTPTLRLTTATALARTPPVARALMLGALSADLELQAVAVVAHLVAVRAVAPDLTTLLIEDDTGQTTVVVPTLAGALPALLPGDVVQVVGVVTHYQAEAQITLRTAQDLQVLSADMPLPSASAEPTALTPIGQVRVGSVTKVVGVVTDVQSLPFGFAFTVADDSGQLQMVVEAALYEALPETASLQRGARVQVFGLVRLLSDTVQLSPETPNALQVLAPGTVPTQTVPIASLGLAQVGQTVTLSATVVTTQTFGGGQRFTLQDATGSLTLQVWENLSAYLPAAGQWPLGQHLRVTGRLTADEGQLVLEPQLGTDVVLQK